MRIKLNMGVVASIKYEYDAKGRLISKTDANKNEIKYIYKTSNSIFPEITEYPNSFKLERQYDEVGRLISENNFGVETKFKYNKIDKPVEVTLNNGLRELRRYDSDGRLIETIPPKANIQNKRKQSSENDSYRYYYNDNYDFFYIENPSRKRIMLNDVFGKFISERDDNTLFKYDFVGNIIEKRILRNKDYEGDSQLYNVTLYTYDKNQNIIQIKEGIEAVEADDTPVSFRTMVYGYDNRNNVNHIHKSSGEDRRFYYKGIDRLVKEVIRINEDTEHVIVYEYNEIGLLSKKVELMDFKDADIESLSDDLKNASSVKIKTLFEYDENGLLIKITLPNGESIDLAYDNDGKIILNEENGFLADSEVNGVESSKKNVYDKNGRIIKKIYSDGSYKLFEYDFTGNIVAVTDSKGETISFKYNSINKLKEKIAPDGIKTVFLYGADGEASRTMHE